MASSSRRTEGRRSRRGRGRAARLAMLTSAMVWTLWGPPVPPASGQEEARTPEEPVVRSLSAPGQAGRDAPGDRLLKNRLNMEEVEILGEVEKPKTMFVIPRAAHEYSWESTQRDFTDDILAPISRQQLEGLERWEENASLR